LGQTGVGKTYLAKKLAEFLFESPDALVRIDMSEYMEKFNVSRLVGSPPGYVGYEEGGILTEKIRRRPYCVILLDEVEKAHPDIFNILLQVMDEGHLTDSLGHRVDFKNTVLIMTSNIGVRQLRSTSKYGFADAVNDDSFTNIKSKIDEELRRAFNPEFLNRVDDFVFFHPLTTEHAKNIVDLALLDVSRKLKDQDIRFELSDEAKKLIAEQGFDPQYGARPLKRAIQKLVEDPIADELLKGTFSEGSVIKIEVKNKTELTFTDSGTKKNKARDIEIH